MEQDDYLLGRNGVPVAAVTLNGVQSSHDKAFSPKPDGSTLKKMPPLVVGIGASAGGLQALKEFFAAMPADSGLAFLVVMHLPPDPTCRLSEILSGYTPMNTLDAQEGMALLPNTVYILPAGRDLVPGSGCFQRCKTAKTDRVDQVIDRVFCALVEELSHRVIAIILSGAGNDGSRGVTAVKRGGGIVFAQTPASARYPDMPKNAIDTLDVHMVLLPAQMPEKIIEICQLLQGGAPRTEHHPARDAEFAEILALVKAKTGHDFGSYKSDTVMRRIQRRMALNGLNELAHYVLLLRDNPLEANALHKDILIGVTSFFRDPEAFSTLQEKVIPQLFANRGEDEAVRIWLPCCATGEEVYSLAILIKEYLHQERLSTKVQLFASDLDDGAVARARNGLFALSIAQNITAERLGIWFSRIDNQYKVVKPLREMVVFAQHSLIKDPPFSRLDLLVCRNFLIYMNKAMQQQLITMFHQVVKPGGFLFLGSSETLGRHGDLFTPVDKKWKIYQRHASASRGDLALRLSSPASASPPLARAFPPCPKGLSPTEAVEKQLMERFFPPGAVVDDKYQAIYLSNLTSRFLIQQTGEPTRDILKMVRRELRPLLRVAIHNAVAARKPCEFHGIKVVAGNDAALVHIKVEPVDAAPAQKLALITFELISPPTVTQCEPVGHKGELPDDDAEKDALILQLEEQLRLSHDQLHATMEQLDSSNEGFMSVNEELISTNEELQATNEELETSKEELQTLNEELNTVNAELRDKVAELDHAICDMEHLFTSSEIATIFLDRQLTIMRFSPAISSLLHIIPTDIGRPFRHMVATSDWPDLANDAKSVLEKLTPVEREVATPEGEKHYLMRILPYRTNKGRVDGIVATFIDITERKKSEARTSHLASFAQLNPDPILEVDACGKVVLSNPAAQRVLEGLAMNEKELSAFLPEDLDDILRELRKGELTSVYREVSIKSRVFAEAIHFVPQFGVVRFYIYDMTERKRAADSLSQSEARYRGLFDHMLEGFAFCQMLFDEEAPLDFVYLAVNDAFHTLTGLKDVVGKKATEAIPGIRERDPELFEVYARVALSREAARFETYVESLGMWFDISVYSPDRGYFVAVFDVITKRKEAEKALRESEEHYERIAATVPAVLYDFVPRLDGDGEFRYLSPRCSEIFELEAEVLLKDKSLLASMIPATDLARLHESEMTGGYDARSNRNEVRIVTPSGRAKWIQLTARQNPSAPGETPVWSGVILDITERKRGEEEREKAERLESLGVLAGGIAHDFNNILTAIIGNISLARSKVGTEHAAAAQLAACEMALSKATDLARQLLTFSRGGEPVKVLVDPELLLREVVSFALHGSNCTAELSLQPGLWCLQADLGQLHQVMYNLVINALQAMPGGGTITVRAENKKLVSAKPQNLPPGRYLKIVVSDQGSGIPREFLGKIFDPYFTTKSDGTGLGLASVFSIVKRHGGSIDVASTPGKGAEFTLLLPADRGLAGAKGEIDEVAAVAPALASGSTVLVMDDEEMIRVIASKMLEALGYQAATCADGARAVSMYRERLERGERFAAVILDMTVPGKMGGREAAKRMHDMDADAVLIISSGYSVDASNSQETSTIFSGSVAKPYNLQQLARELARVLKRQ